MNKDKVIDIDSSEAKSAIDVETGCLFRDRCKFCTEICKRDKPKL